MKKNQVRFNTFSIFPKGFCQKFFFFFCKSLESIRQDKLYLSQLIAVLIKYGRDLGCIPLWRRDVWKSHKIFRSNGVGDMESFPIF